MKRGHALKEAFLTVFRKENLMDTLSEDVDGQGVAGTTSLLELIEGFSHGFLVICHARRECEKVKLWNEFIGFKKYRSTVSLKSLLNQDKTKQKRLQIARDISAHSLPVPTKNHLTSLKTWLIR